MRLRAFRLAYDGRPYHGFQRQPDVPTVEDTLFDALRALNVTSAEPEQYSAAGRTDAGVSAVEQTVAFQSPDWLTPTVLNSELPDTIRAWAATDVPEEFHATHDAQQRVYTYHLHAPDIDDAAVQTATNRLSGQHDFQNLTPDDHGTKQDLLLITGRDDAYLVIVAQADGFPRHLVRRLVGVLENIGAGTLSSDVIDTLLDPATRQDRVSVPTAPAYPLLLHRVDYGLTFDRTAGQTARQAFDAIVTERRTAARVASRLQAGIDSEI